MRWRSCCDPPAGNDISRLKAGAQCFFGLRGGWALASRRAIAWAARTGYIALLASTATEGTRAAVEYMTQPHYAARLVARLRKARGEVPQYFQVVVRARFKGHTLIHVEDVAVR